MKLTARLALSQLKINKVRTIWTLIGIILSTAIITGVYSLGFASGLDLVDRLIGDSDSRAIFEQTIAGLAAVMSIFILSISIIVVSNAFRVSAGERRVQFGILKSVGATKRQITQTVVYEAVFLTLAGIPIGIIIGLLLQLAGVSIINHFMHVIIQDDYNFYAMYGNQLIRFVFSGFALSLSLVVSFVTVMVSAWIPASKAAKIPAINAIRGAGEVDVRNRKVFAVGLIGKIFKTEGLLASKFLKRSKRNFRATVISLSFSVILFVAAGAFFGMMNRVSDLFWGGPESNVRISLHPYEVWEEVEGIWEQTGDASRDITAVELSDISTRLQTFLGDNDTIFGAGRGFSMSILPEEMITDGRWEVMEDRWQQWGNEGTPNRDEALDEFLLHNITLLMVQPDMYAELIQAAGVEMGSNILINHQRYRFTDGRRTEFAPFNFSGQTLELHDWDDYTGETVATGEIELHAELKESEVSAELLAAMEWWHSELTIIVPETDIFEYQWFVYTDDTEAFISYAEELVLPLVEEEVIDFSYFDMQAMRVADQNMMRLLMVLTFGFVGLLTAIGLTNVISTISENVRTRGKEFAVLQSVGMTNEGIKRMLSMESVFSALKALMLGIPGGILASFLLHQMIGHSAEFAYQLPWMPIGISIVAVFAITWLTMRYAANRLKDRNIIESIRGAGG